MIKKFIISHVLVKIVVFLMLFIFATNINVVLKIENVKKITNW